MSKYILNHNNTLILNGEVYVLAREKKITTNNVCSLCSLNNMCFDIVGSSNLLKLCMRPDLDGRWFFIDCQNLSKSDIEDIMSNISECLDFDF